MSLTLKELQMLASIYNNTLSEKVADYFIQDLLKR